MASTKLTKSQSGTSTNEYKGTLSWWMKRSNVSSTQYILSMESGQERFLWYITSGNEFGGNYRASGGSPDSDLALTGSPKFRDCNAWYHCVLAWDTSQGTQLNRIRFYVNNVEYVVTQSQTINQNTVFPINKSSFGSALELFAQGSSSYFDGIVSHVYYVDGQQLTPSTFGETDSTTGEWKINTNPTVTIGTQGYIILKDGNTITDQSTNSNNFTLASGTLTKTEDCPSNVFATLNPLHPSLNTSRAFSNGNTYVALGGTARVPEVSTLGMTSGKYYAEAKVTGGSGGNSIFGIVGEVYRDSASRYLGKDTYDYAYVGSDGNKMNNNSSSSYGSSFTTGDIIGIAVDLDNLKIYFSKNGVWQDSGDPTSGATGTGSAFTLASPSSTDDGAYFFACSDDNIYAEQRIAWNFGNGDFSGNGITSAGTNASGNGIFEYDVPTGYTALSTKGLNL